MSETENENETPEAQPSSEQESEGTAAEAGPGRDDPYTSEDGVPDWMVGKTPQEVAQTADQLAQTIQNFDPGQQQQQSGQVNQSGQNVAQQRQQFQQAQQQVQQSQQQQPGLPDPDLWTYDPQTAQQQLTQYMNQQVQNQVNQAASQFGGNVGKMARRVVANDNSYSDIFNRWGHEVDKLLADNGVPMAQRTTDAYEMAARMVKADHVDELVEDKIEKRGIAQPQSGTERSSPSGPTPEADSGGDALDEFWRSNHPRVNDLKDNQLSKSDIRKFAGRMNISVGDYVDQLKSDTIITTQKTNTVQQNVTGG